MSENKLFLSVRAKLILLKVMLKIFKRMLLVHRFDGFFCFLNWFFKAFLWICLRIWGHIIWVVTKKGRGPDPLGPSMDTCKNCQKTYLWWISSSNKCTEMYNKFNCFQQNLSSLTENSTEKYYNDLSTNWMLQISPLNLIDSCKKSF